MSNYSLESEQAVIGACLTSDEAYDICADLISQHDFFVADHRLIFAAIASLYDSGKGVDLVTVNTRLAEIDPFNERSFQDAEESLAFMAALQDAVSTLRHVRDYARAVKDRSLQRSLRAAADEIIALADSSDGIGEKLAQAESVLQAVTNSARPDTALTSPQIAINVYDDLMERIASGGRITGLSTGLQHVDDMLNGLKKTNLIVIAGRPGSGKTTLAMNIAEAVARTNKVIVFSLEMSSTELGNRMMSATSSIAADSIQRGKLSDDEKGRAANSLMYMKGLNMVVDDQPALHVSEAMARARVISRRMGGCDLIVIDYLQLLRGDGENRTNEIGHVSRSLKTLAKQMNCPVIALAQLNRAKATASDKRPELTDLRGSGEIEQDADVVAFVHREKEYNPQTALKDNAEFIVKKNRHGSTGTIYLIADLAHMRFKTQWEKVFTDEDMKAKAEQDAAYEQSQRSNAAKNSVMSSFRGNGR